MTVSNISLQQVQIFLLIFLRVSAVMMIVPIFNSKSIPIIFKVGLALSISYVLFPVLKLENTPFLADPIHFGIGVAGEIIVGIIIGLSVRLLFAAIQLAGQLAGFQMGFAIANVMDPITSTQASIIAQINNIIAMVMFLAINAHHWFLRGLVESFRLVPPFSFRFSASLMEEIIRLAGNMFIIAIKVGAPVIIALLLVSIAFGLIARTVPQMNVFIVAMPLKIIIGLLFLIFSLPFFSTFFRQIFSNLGNDIALLLKTM